MKLGLKTILAIAVCFMFPALLAPPASAGGAPVRIGYLQADIHQLACWAAMDKGFYKAQGLKVEVAGIFRAGPEEMSAFAAGDLDMGYVGEAPATVAVANHAARVRAAAQVNTEGSAIVVGLNSPIKTPADLAGKTAAVPGHATVQDFLLKKALYQAGVDQQKVKIIVLKPPEMIGALRTGQIDAFIAWEPYPAKAQTMKVGRVLITSDRIWKDHPCCILAVDQRFLDARPGDVKKMVKAHVQATEFIRRHPEEALKIGVKYTGMDAATVRLAMKNVNYTCALSVEGERRYVEFLAKLGYIKVKDSRAFIKGFLHPETLEEVTGK